MAARFATIDTTEIAARSVGGSGLERPADHSVADHCVADSREAVRMRTVALRLFVASCWMNGTGDTWRSGPVAWRRRREVVSVTWNTSSRPAVSDLRSSSSRNPTHQGRSLGFEYNSTQLCPRIITRQTSVLCVGVGSSPGLFGI